MDHLPTELAPATTVDKESPTSQDGTKSHRTLTLMSLPTEVRFQIWTEVLGGQTIHLEYHFKPPSNRHILSRPEKWSHYVCLTQMSENEIHQRFLCEPTEYDPYRQERHLDHEDCEYHHTECRNPGYHDMEKVNLSLGLLQTSKTIHAEADHVLLTTNMFSIDNEQCFTTFFARLSLERRALLANLHLSIPATNIVDNFDPWAPRGKSGVYGWNTHLKPELVSQLTGLRTLHVCMGQAFYHKRGVGTMKDRDLESVLGLCNFKLLGKQLKTLTISLTDVNWIKTFPAAGPGPTDFEEEYQWTVKERQDFCERLRRKILDLGNT